MVRPGANQPDLTRPYPTRPWRSLTAYFSNVLKDTTLNLQLNIGTGLIILDVNFDWDFFISSVDIALFAKKDFVIFTYTFAYHLRTNKSFQNLIISREKAFEDLSKSL